MSNAEYKRQYVKPGQTLSEWESIEPYCAHLRSANVQTPPQLNEWLLDWSELSACVDEEGTDRYVKMTCQTDSEERKKAFLDFVENVEPKCKPVWHELNRKYVEMRGRVSLPAERFDVFDRSVKSKVGLFRDENVKLQVEESKLEQQYQEVTGAMTVTHEGTEQTLQQVSTHLEKTDRAVREEVWGLVTTRRLTDADRLEKIFDDLFALRHRIALNTDNSDFLGYVFEAKERFDYSAADCVAFHEAVEKACVPLMRAEQERRKELLGVERLRPWDLAVDPKGRSPLTPFGDPKELVEKCGRIFDRLDADLAEQFRDMANDGWLDLESRKGKAPGGYQSTYHEQRRPFIFMNAVGLQRDVRTLIHEAGHAFHAFASRDEPLIHYRSAPMEFSEVASMGMEMFAYEYFDEFYSGEELVRAKRQQLEGIVSLFPWVATIDAFQHWMYTHPEHTREERRATWLSLLERFGGIEDWSGFEEARGRSWQRQLHLFEVPFYYIEYGIAQLGALQLWLNAKKDLPGTLRLYREAMALGGSRPLPDLFEAAGIRFDFSTETLAPLMEAVQAELATLAE